MQSQAIANRVLKYLRRLGRVVNKIHPVGLIKHSMQVSLMCIPGHLNASVHVQIDTGTVA